MKYSIFLFLLLFMACQLNTDIADKIETLSPGLGEYMAMADYHHTNLKIALEKNNYKRATYELDELEEVFAKAVQLHNNHEKLIQSLDTLKSIYMNIPIKNFRLALQKKDTVNCINQYKVLTQGCNGCHTANDMAFIVIEE